MPTRAERLADHFIRCAGIASVCVDAGGIIGAIDVAGIACPAGRVMLCCARGSHAKVATLAAASMRAGRPARSRPSARSRLNWASALTPHETVIRRAFAAVAAVSETIADMQRTGGMKELNRDFKIARKADPRLRYQDYLHDRQAAMLEAIARRP